MSSWRFLKELFTERIRIGKNNNTDPMAGLFPWLFKMKL